MKAKTWHRKFEDGTIEVVRVYAPTPPAAGWNEYPGDMPEWQEGVPEEICNDE